MLKTRYDSHYYKPHDAPDWQGRTVPRLTVDWERPVDMVESPDGFSMMPQPRGRTRIILEGESEFVERLYQAMRPTVEQIRAEIEAEHVVIEDA